MSYSLKTLSQYKKLVSLVCTIVILVLGYFIAPTDSKSGKNAKSFRTTTANHETKPLPDIDPQRPYKISRVIDGDTIVVEVSDGKVGTTTVTVRMIGIDTPETVDPRKPVQCFGKQASSYTHTILDGQNVFLMTDNTQDKTDRYGRLLAYVATSSAIASTTQTVNEVILRNGYAHEYTYDIPYVLQSLFKSAEKDAREHERGLWSPDLLCV